ncbi:hypothetical protein M0811_00304 [Anaeramoeba ignava]|uniref:Dickkopf N-terminal cysteine-rich domain-containing protein n=1 Tax=Anaeramoeba ignava TaxID=1746090 RepID=A0A9Q0LR28_ANAIG|nr:hypothetical protein M0811_00304 [Anaeramoeba ignava]
MKFIAFFIIILTLALYSDQCPTTFAHLGEYCNKSENISCYQSLECVDYKCSYQNNGAYCESNESCSSHFCYNNECLGFQKVPGDSCQINEQCYTTNNCNNGICQGISIGETCLNGSRSSCKQEAFCGDFGTGYKCTESIEFGESCTAASQVLSSGDEYKNLCKDFRMCMPNGNATDFICDDIFSRDIGEYCTTHFGCKLGLYCQNPSPIGTCQNFIENTIYCENGDDCPFGTTCDCNSSTCTQTGNFNSMNEIENGLNCFGEYQCLFNDPFKLGSCAINHCLNEVKNLQCAMSTNYEDTFYTSAYWNCHSNNQCPTTFAHLGEYCNKSENISCYQSLECVDYKCSYQNNGAYCESNESCSSHFCYNNECLGFQKVPGDSCQINEQCYTTNNCTNGICQGISIGETCLNGSRSSCEQEAFCGDFGTGYKCTESIEFEESCTSASQVLSSGDEYKNLCKDFRMCMPNGNATDFICDDIFSRDIGEYCTTHFGCKLGLYCQNPSPIGTCQNFIENTIYCENGDDCPFGTICDCNSSTCTQTGNFNSMNEIENGLSCFGEYQCLFNDPFKLGSCAINHCLNEVKNLQCAMSTNYEDTFYTSAYWNCHSTNAQSTMILSFGLLIGSLLFFF